MIQIDLITGILGSGKTTFIRKYVNYLNSKNEKVAILENDHGAVNVDMMILSDLESKLCHLEMIAGGCDADCHKRRFKTKLIALSMMGFKRVILEPSGIFDVDEFFDILYEEPLDKWYQIGNIITIIDAGLESELSQQSEFLLGSQAANAGILIMSKTSGKSEAELKKVLEHVNQSLDRISCRRTFDIDDDNIITKDWNALNWQDMEKICSASYKEYAYVKEYFNENTSSTHYFMHVKMDRDRLKGFVRGLFNDKELGDIYRIKGFMPDKDSWIELNATRHVTNIKPIDKGQDIFIVIGDDLKFEKIDERFRGASRDPEYKSI